MATSKLTPQQLRFAEILANPENGRTQADIAEELGVCRETLSRWKLIDGFAEAVHAIALSFVGAELPQVYAALLRSAKSGNVPAARLLLEVTGVIKANNQLQPMANNAASEAERQEERERKEQERIRQMCTELTPEQVALLRQAEAIARKIYLVELSEPADEVAVGCFAQAALTWPVMRGDSVSVQESVSLAFETLQFWGVEDVRVFEGVTVRHHVYN